MRVLRPTTDKMQVIASASCDVDIVCDYVDRDTTSFIVGLVDSQYTNLTDTTPTDIVGAPASGKARNVKAMNFRNVGAVSVDLTVLVDVSGTDYEMLKVTLLGGQTLEWIEGVGFFLPVISSLLNRTFRMSADYVNATTSFTDITGLSCPLLSGKFYNFDAALIHVNDAVTTGSRFGYNIGAAPTTSIIGSVQTTLPHATTPTFAAGVVTARDTAIAAATAGSTSQHMSWIAGMIQPSADGTFVLRGASEIAVANGLTVKAGSWMRIWEPPG